MKSHRVTLLLCLALVAGAVGCTTSGTFRVPPGSNLYINGRPDPVTVDAAGTVTTKPYFWSAMGVAPKGGVPYRLEQGGQVIKEGRLRAKFRVVSIFWPPFAIIYWPTGLNPDIVYDLVNDTQLPPQGGLPPQAQLAPPPSP